MNIDRVILNYTQWVFVGTAVIFVIGWWLYSAYKMKVYDKDARKAQRARWLTYLGLILMIGSVIFAGYVYYIRYYSKKKATMDGVCDACNDFAARRKALRPFQPEEMGILGRYAEACDRCSAECVKDFEKATLPDVKAYLRKKCTDVTKEAIHAKTQLKRLREKQQEKLAGIRATQVRLGAPALPAVPT